MEKPLSIELPLAVQAPHVPGVDWDEIHEGYLAKLEQERLAAGDDRSEEERFIAAVNEGIASADAGHSRSLEEVKADWEQKFGLRR